MNRIKKQMQDDVLAGKTIDLEGLTGQEYMELCLFADNENTYLELDYPVDNNLEEANTIELYSIVNHENTQCMINTYIDVDDRGFYSAQEYLLFDNSMYDQLISVRNRIEESKDNDEEDVFDFIELVGVDEYNDQVAAYNKYGDALSLTPDMDIDAIISVLQQHISA